MKQTTPAAMRLKAIVRNKAKESGIDPHAMLQNVVFEHFLARLSASRQIDHFIVKGGALVSRLVGLAHRTTMDLDMTLTGLPLTSDIITTALSDICNTDIKDGFHFSLAKMSAIREEDRYGGFCASLTATITPMTIPFCIDITTGDAITPSPQKRTLNGLVDESIRMAVWTYPVETILAEKLETILNRGATNTRPRDFYDVYMLAKTQHIDLPTLSTAVRSTIKHRSHEHQIGATAEVVASLRNSEFMRKQWQNYQTEFNYAANILFEETLDVVERLVASSILG